MRVTETTPRRPRGTLYRYLLREMAVPTLFALLGLTLVILTKDLLGYTELVVNRGFGAGVVAMMAFYQTVPLIGTTLPFATMVGALVALGRLGADLELLVLEACGVSARSLVLPVTLFAAALTGAGLVVSLALGPWASRSLDASLERISLENPGAEVRAGVVNRFGDWKLEAQVANPRGDRLESVLLWMPDVGETVFAQRAALDPEPGGGVRITLENATVLLDPRTSPRKLEFETMTTLLPETDLPLQRDREDRLASLTLRELGSMAAMEGHDDAYMAQQAAIQIHRRFALPLATLVFGFLVMPLFMSRAQFSRSGGGVVGLVATVVYYGLVQLGDGLIQRGLVGIPLGAWLPNLAMAALGLAMFARLAGKSAFGRDADRPTQRVKRSVRRAEARGELRTKRFALARYVASRFVQVAAMCFGVLLVAYLLVDVLDRLQWLFRYGATAGEIARFYLARVPLLASRVVPMALLVATALTVSLVAAQGELMGMRACGIPAPRALRPVLVLCVLVAPLFFVLNNEVVPRTNALADYLKTTEIKDLGGVRSAVWYRVGTAIYELGELDADIGHASDVVIYEVGDGFAPRARIDADEAEHIGGGVWRLVNATRVEVTDGGLERRGATPFVQLGEDAGSDVDTMHYPVGELRRRIAELEQGGRDASALRTDLHAKLAAPLACILLPALALLFAVAGPPFPSSTTTLVASVAAFVAYMLLTGVGTSLGYGGALPPAAAGWLATAALGGLLLALGLRLRGFGQSF
ncbi:MAG: LptF/LptG family permease [Myxococcales bacterium]|nr:LptF/LptG family permease [Myxococcales bacterium]